MEYDHETAEKLPELEAKLPWLLAEPELTFIEKGKSNWVYDFNLLYDSIGIYAAPKQKHARDKNPTDEFIMLPITVGEFSKHRATYFGYQFIFARLEATTAQLFNDTSTSHTSLEIEFRARRFEFQTRGRASIVIRKFRENLFPAMRLNVDAPTTDILGAMQQRCLRTLATYASHYLLFDDI